jgi:enterochelin esterase-like enzyme
MPELLPPAWVPAYPQGSASGSAGALVRSPSRSRAPRLAAVAAAAAIGAGLGALAIRHPGGEVSARRALPSPLEAAFTIEAPAPSFQRLSADAAGSTIESVRFRSASLGREGSFLVYLPPGYASSSRSYPVLYLLHGRDGHADAFLEIGIQGTLDRLIATRRVAPMIAVMVQDAPGLENWRDLAYRHSATYVVEVQELVDRSLRTIATRAGRAIAGSSMGGYGAMNVALANPLRFAAVESWLGFFNGLEGALRSATPVISRLGLHAFLYGAEEDPVAVPSEDPEFAALLRESGADARGVIYPGGHSLEKVKEHLATGIVFAAQSLEQAQRRASAEASRAAAEAARAAAAAQRRRRLEHPRRTVRRTPHVGPGLLH